MESLKYMLGLHILSAVLLVRLMNLLFTGGEDVAVVVVVAEVAFVVSIDLNSGIIASDTRLSVQVCRTYMSVVNPCTTKNKRSGTAQSWPAMGTNLCFFKNCSTCKSRYYRNNVAIRFMGMKKNCGRCGSHGIEKLT